MIKNLVVLGGGSAGLIAALSLRRIVPQLPVRVIRSPEIGVIGVGEGTTRAFPEFLFQRLRLPPGPFYAEAEPTWKLGLRFLWGPRPHFHYTFSKMIDHRWPELPKNNGFYGDVRFDSMDIWSALMEQDRALPRRADGFPEFDNHATLGFHIENRKLVGYLENRCRENAVAITDATVTQVETGAPGIAALHLDTGERVTADLFIDASGFRSELLGKTLAEPFVSYGSSLFTDRAVIGGWPRTTEVIRPYTTAETMDAGWAWQIEHEHWINRGYVYSSAHLSDEDALAELLRKNPKIAGEPRVVRFRSGRYARMWVKNVVAIGNSSGFVEPLEATALQAICDQARTLAVALGDSDFDPSPSVITLYNRFRTLAWDDIRDFLAVHYRFNTRSDTAFWRECREKCDLAGAAPLCEFYRENGPSALGKSIFVYPHSAFAQEGYMALLVGQRVPYARVHTPNPAEIAAWQTRADTHSRAAQQGFTVADTLRFIRDPRWRWG